PNSKSYYLNFNHHGGLSISGTVKPSFNGVSGSSFWDGGCHWFFFCKWSDAQPWKQSTGYTNWYASGGNHSPSNAAIEPFLQDPSGTNPVYLQVPTNNGTSGSSYAPFLASQPAGTVQPDGQLLWLGLGSGT